MSNQTLPYDLGTEHMCIGCLAACAVSIVVIAWALATFVWFRARVDCCFNRFLIAFLLMQLLQCVQKSVFAAFTIVNNGLPFVLCDINASLDQFLDFTSMWFLVAFFVGLSNARRFWETSINVIVYCVAPMLGVVSLAAIWAFLADRKPGYSYDDAPYFSQSLAWCWIPSTDDHLALVQNAHDLDGLQFFLGYLPMICVAGSAIFAYCNQRCRTGETWLGKGVIIRRFLGTAVFPVAIYILGMPIRLSLSGKSDTVRISLSTIYPLLGAVVSVVFLWTESALPWVPRLLLKQCVCADGVVDADATRAADDRSKARLDALQEDSAPPSPYGQIRAPGRSSGVSTLASPRNSGLSPLQDTWLVTSEATPFSFTATMRAMMCDAVVGQHVASSRAYDGRGRREGDEFDDRYSISSTHTNFAATQEREQGEYIPAFDIQIDPASQRDVTPKRRPTEEPTAGSLTEMHTSRRLGDSNSKFTTRSESSLHWVSPAVRVVESGTTPSSSMLNSYKANSSGVLRE